MDQVPYIHFLLVGNPMPISHHLCLSALHYHFLCTHQPNVMVCIRSSHCTGVNKLYYMIKQSKQVMYQQNSNMYSSFSERSKVLLIDHVHVGIGWWTGQLEKQNADSGVWHWHPRDIAGTMAVVFLCPSCQIIVGPTCLPDKGWFMPHSQVTNLNMSGIRAQWENDTMEPTGFNSGQYICTSWLGSCILATDQQVCCERAN